MAHRDMKVFHRTDTKQCARKILRAEQTEVGKPTMYINLVNKTNLVHNLFLAYLSISTCLGQLHAHHQE